MGYYNINLQKVLFIVSELHKKGFEKVRIVPSVSPSGMAWRCVYTNGGSERIIASNWIQSNFKVDSEEIENSIEELTNMFEREHQDFLNHCKGNNLEYVEWYSSMVISLEEGELPFAFADYFSPTEYWLTSKDKKIYTLPDERKYYTY